VESKPAPAPAAVARAAPLTRAPSSSTTPEKEVVYVDVDGKPWAELRVRVHMEDTNPAGGLKACSLDNYTERMRSQALWEATGANHEKFAARNLAILINEFAMEIKGASPAVQTQVRVQGYMDFPMAPQMYWTTRILVGDEVYATQKYGHVMCARKNDGSYAPVNESRYAPETVGMRKVFSSPWKRGTTTTARFFAEYPDGGAPFAPVAHKKVGYRVRQADCDMYNVLFHPRVQEILETVAERGDCTAAYINLRTPTQPFDDLVAHQFIDENGSSLFLLCKGAELIFSAIAHYGEHRGLTQQQIKCAANKAPALAKFVNGGDRPANSPDLDLTMLP
jgi:acyl-CoA thioesterase FadM